MCMSTQQSADKKNGYTHSNPMCAGNTLRGAASIRAHARGLRGDASIRAGPARSRGHTLVIQDCARTPSPPAPRREHTRDAHACSSISWMQRYVTSQLPRSVSIQRGPRGAASRRAEPRAYARSPGEHISCTEPVQPICSPYGTGTRFSTGVHPQTVSG